MSNLYNLLSYKALVVGVSIWCPTQAFTQHASIRVRAETLRSTIKIAFDTGALYSRQQISNGFAMPPKKTPPIAGGSSGLLEDIDGRVNVCVYPVAQSAIVSMTLPNYQEAMSVRVKDILLETGWTGIRVRNAEGKLVDIAAAGRGFALVPNAGEHSTVEAGG
jgi:hypothetical protein